MRKFHLAPRPFSLADVATLVGSPVPEGADAARSFDAVAALDRAGPRDVAFFAGDVAIDDLAATRAGACLVATAAANDVPRQTIALAVDDPIAAFRQVALALEPESAAPFPLVADKAISSGSVIHPTAMLEADVTVAAGVVVGPGAAIGSGTVLGANAVIGAGVMIGRGCMISPLVSICNALLGDRVRVHPGAQIGQAGAGAPEPFVGRVIVQNDVVIGANAAVSRGRILDTVIGEGAVLAAFCDIAGDTTIGRMSRVGRP